MCAPFRQTFHDSHRAVLKTDTGRHVTPTTICVCCVTGTVKIRGKERNEMCGQVAETDTYSGRSFESAKLQISGRISSQKKLIGSSRRTPTSFATATLESSPRHLGQGDSRTTTAGRQYAHVQPVASLGWCHPGRQLRVSRCHPHFSGKMTTFLVITVCLSVLQCHPYLFSPEKPTTFFCSPLSLLLISLGCHPLEGVTRIFFTCPTSFVHYSL